MNVRISKGDLRERFVENVLEEIYFVVVKYMHMSEIKRLG